MKINTIDSTFEISKSPSAINTRVFTCLPVFGQTKSNIARRIYRDDIDFVPPFTSAVEPL